MLGELELLNLVNFIKMLSALDQKILFFHTSAEYREEFTHNLSVRPCFYWFGDRYHCHYGYSEYFYIFLAKPKQENITFILRDMERRGFDNLYTHFLEYKKEVETIDRRTEPPIMMTFDRTEPIISLKLISDFKYEVIKPVEFKGRVINFGDKETKIPFNQIRELFEMVPEILTSVPIVPPEKVGNRYEYTDWQEKVDGGTWL